MPTTTATQSIQNMPQWAEDQYKVLVDRAMGLSQTPYEAFPGPRMAPFTEDQMSAFSMGRENVGVGSAIGAEALDMTRGAMQAPTAAGIQQYMNPYNERVTQNMIRELGRQNTIGAQGEAAQAARLGTFGGSRTGVVESERARNFDRMISDVLAQQLSSSYEQGLGQFNKQQTLGLQGAQMMGGLGGMQQQFGQQDVTQMLGLGSLQQAQGQQSLELGYEDFIRQQQYPYAQVGYAADILRGTPSAQQVSTKTTETEGPSIGSQIAGIGIGALGILGGTGAFGSGGWLNFGG